MSDQTINPVPVHPDVAAALAACQAALALAGTVADMLHERDYSDRTDRQLLDRLDRAYDTYQAAIGSTRPAAAPDDPVARAVEALGHFGVAATTPEPTVRGLLATWVHSGTLSAGQVDQVVGRIRGGAR